MINIKYPIIQAPIGGVVTPELAAAVSNFGGLGGLALSWSSPDEAEILILKLKSLSRKPFYANFVLNFEPLALKRTLELGVKIIHFSWGMPTASMVNLVKSFDATMGIQVTNKESAQSAIALGADYLICQGTQAGGHVQATKSLQKALKEVLQVTPLEIPVFVAGGISKGKDLDFYLKRGASGVVMGTRFVASKESSAHQIYKDTLVKSKAKDTVLTACMCKGWSNAVHRIIRNSTFNAWESDGCALQGNRPGEHDIVGKNSNGNDIERYSMSTPSAKVSGDISAMTFYAGKSVNGINSIKSADEIMNDIWKEYQDIKNQLTKRTI